MRKIIAAILRKQAIWYLNRQKAKIVVITGSVGKTSTTQAIATVLSEAFKVQKTVKNYNTDLGVPCSIFNQKLPDKLFNPFSWLFIIIKNTLKIFSSKRINVFVLELGTDKPGEIQEFSWLRPDIAVVTAVAAEHMEYFGELDEVAKEELAVSHFSDKTIINREMVGTEYLKFSDSDQLYNYSREDIAHINLKAEDLHVHGKHSIDAVAAGIAVGKDLGMNSDLLVSGAKKVKPQPGRMNVLKGLYNSTLIDDTYNSSPEAVMAALDYLYSIAAEPSHKIALLGNMNELGATSEELHRRIGQYCDPKKLKLVVTLGKDANRYTAEEAEKKGCSVARVESPYKAAEVIKDNLKESSVVLLKGSQNGVFAEEAVKLLLQNESDINQLVRQDKFWISKKEENFKDAKD